jgi:hypothetical protein
MPRTRYEAAERIARAIYFNGWDSLSVSEENLLQIDCEFRVLVESLISELRRHDMLIGSGPAEHPLEFYKEITSEFIVNWEFEDIAREARLWKHEQTGRVVLEIKEWSRDDFHRAVESGAHDIIFQQTIEFDNTDELLEKCKKILYQYNCPKEKINEIQI